MDWTSGKWPIATTEVNPPIPEGVHPYTPGEGVDGESGFQGCCEFVHVEPIGLDMILDGLLMTGIVKIQLGSEYYES